MTTRAGRRGVLRRALLTRQALPFSLDRYQVAALPPAARWEGAQVHVSDETDGPVTCFSDGVNWRRITDRAIVSAVTPTALSAGGSGAGHLGAMVGPYLVGTGRAIGTFSTASYQAAALLAGGRAVGVLQTPPKVPADLSATASGVATANASCVVSVALSAVGRAQVTLQGGTA